MARIKDDSELEEVRRRCRSWGDTFKDRMQAWPATTMTYRMIREGEGAGSGRRAHFNVSPDDQEIEEIFHQLKPWHQTILKCEYIEHSQYDTDKKKAGSCELSETTYKTRLNYALCYIAGWLKSGYCRGK